jgi:hypothetical protein
LYATFCNIAFNGLGGCCGEIKPEREAHRINLERHYMIARDRFHNSAGLEGLADFKKESIQRIFLNIFVVEDNLAVSGVSKPATSGRIKTSHFEVR